MKKSTRIALLVALSFLVLGALLCGFSYVLGGGNLGFAYEDGAFQASPYHSEKSSADGALRRYQQEFSGIDALAITSDFAEIQFSATAPGQNLVLTYTYPALRPAPLCEVQGSTLCFVSEYKKADGFLQGFALPRSFPFWGQERDFAEQYTLSIEYPKDFFFRSLSINSSMGDILLRNLAVSGELQVDLDLGDVTMQTVDAQTLNADLSLGELSFNNVNAAQMSLSNDLGDVLCKNLTTNALKAKLNAGDLTLEGALQGTTHVECDLGDITLRTSLPRSTYHIEADVDLGNLRVNDKPHRDAFENPENAPNSISASCSAGNIHLFFAS